MIPKQMQSFRILKDDERKFTSWISVEIKDNQGDIVPIREELVKTLDAWMDMGAPIIDTHTNKIVGKGLNWQFDEKDGKPGIMITGKVYNLYKLHDIAWEKLKKGDYAGMSIGATSGKQNMSMIQTDDGSMDTARALKDIELFEVSLVDSPANPEATIDEVNIIAKSNIKDKEKDDIAKAITKKELHEFTDKMVRYCDKNKVAITKDELEAFENRLKEAMK